MAILVQSSSGNLSTMIWYRGDEVENNPDLLWCYNTYGVGSGGWLLNTERYIYLPAGTFDIQGIIIALRVTGFYTVDRTIYVELQESTDGGTTWTTVRTASKDFITQIANIPSYQYGYYIVDFRFSTSYTTNATYSYRFRIYQSATGTGNIMLVASLNGSNVQDVTNWAFRIIYTTTTATLTTTDVIVVTSQLSVDQNLTLGYITIPTTSKGGIDNYVNKVSIYITTGGQIYIPPTITTNISITITGRIYLTAGKYTWMKIGDSSTSPIPWNIKKDIFFDSGTTYRRSGTASPTQTGAGIEIYGSPPPSYWADLKYDAPAGQSQIVVSGNVGWSVGDTIMIAGTKYSPTRHYYDYNRDIKEYTITAISYDPVNDETTITLDRNLAYMREAGGKVIYLERNVVLRGTTSLALLYTSTLEFTYAGRIYIENAKIYYFLQINIRDHNAYLDQTTLPQDVTLKGCVIHTISYVNSINRTQTTIDTTAIVSETTLITQLYKNKSLIEANCVIFGNIQHKTDKVEAYGFWIQAYYPFIMDGGGLSKIHDGTIFNSPIAIDFYSSSKNEVYNITAKSIFLDDAQPPNTSQRTGVFAYENGNSFDNYIHDITITGGASSIVWIYKDAGTTDWIDNVSYDTIKTDVNTFYRNDWTEITEVKLTNIGIQYNDWIYYKYGRVHRTGNYAGADDTTYRVEGGKNFALKIITDTTGTPFDYYIKTLTGVKANKPVFYVGYIYVPSAYYSGTNVSPPEIILYGAGIDYTTEPTARYVHSGSTYADQWVPFVVAGTPKQDGVAFVKIVIKTDSSTPYIYIDDDLYTWSEVIDYRSHEEWVQGRPADPPAVFPNITSLEVWSTPTTSIIGTATIGRQIVEHTGIVIPTEEQLPVNTPVKIIFAHEKENPYPVKINIYRDDGTLVVNSQPMTKIGTTRYYYYDWTPTQTGNYIIECYVENYKTQDTILLKIVDKDINTLLAEHDDRLKKHDSKMTALKFV